MTELGDVAVALVERAAEGEQLEAFVTHERDFYAKAFEGEIEALSSSEPRGAGVRIVAEHRVGFAFTTDMTEEGLTDVVSQARQNSAHAGSDEAAGIAEGWAEPPKRMPDLVDGRQAEVDPSDKAHLAVELERATHGADPRVRAVEEAVYADSDTEIAIATTSGIKDSYRRTDAWCFAVAIATEGEDTEVGFDFDLGRGWAELDPQDVAQRAAHKALDVLGASKIPSATMPVVFEPYVAGQFLSVLGSALTAEAVQKGRSLFAGRIGETVAADSLGLVDDGRAPGAPGSSPWDAEGVVTQRTDVIESGVLRSFVYDTTTARREGRRSTGNASRAGFKSVPTPAPSNLSFVAEELDVGELLRRAGRAFLVQDFHGVHSGANPVTGDFSVGATGRLLDGGAPAQPVKEVTIAAPMVEILRRIESVGSDRRWLPFGGSYGGATTLVSEMTIAGS